MIRKWLGNVLADIYTIAIVALNFHLSALTIIVKKVAQCKALYLIVF